MVDPLAEVVTLLQPSAQFSKSVTGAGLWRVHRSNVEDPFYCVVFEGACRLAIDGHDPIGLRSGDFILVPDADGIAMSSLESPPKGVETRHTEIGNGEFRIGALDGPTDLRVLVGHFRFGSPDAALLVSLLPRLIHVRGKQRLATLVTLIREESRAQRPAREMVLTRLLEVVLIEALRSTADAMATPGLVQGLVDERLAIAIRLMHENPAHSWTIAQLASQAALSRSAFFERFSRVVGVAPMEYLLTWRMALAKTKLREKKESVAQIAEQVGYSSASTFSVAFIRHTGLTPARYARQAVVHSRS